MSTPPLATPKAPVSVLIPTKDEERNLPSTLGHLQWADEIVVFDSHSTDDTVEIARQWGCKVHQRAFDNFSAHKNWALENIDFRNDWILILDADEKVPPELAQEIAAVCTGNTGYDAYYIARQIWVDGVWLKHAGKYPDYNIRLFRKGRAWYERRIVHEHMVVDGPVGFLRNHLVHVDAKGTYRYVDRHNRYAEMEAVEAFIAIRTAAPVGSLVKAVGGRTSEGRRVLKTYAYRFLPFRPLLAFLYLYVIKRGFVMGRAGVKTCMLRMFYEYMVDLYLEELRDSTSPAYLKYQDYIEDRCAAAAGPATDRK